MEVCVQAVQRTYHLAQAIVVPTSAKANAASATTTPRTDLPCEWLLVADGP